MTQLNLEAVNHRWKEVYDEHRLRRQHSVDEDTQRREQVDSSIFAPVLEDPNATARKMLQEIPVASDPAHDMGDVEASPVRSSSVSASEVQQSNDLVPEPKPVAAEPPSLLAYENPLAEPELFAEPEPHIPQAIQKSAEPKLSRRERILQLARENARQPLAPELIPPPPKSKEELEQERQKQKRLSIRERLRKLVGGPFL